MLLTGRYDFEDDPNPAVRKLTEGTPHLGDLFKERYVLYKILILYQLKISI